MDRKLKQISHVRLHSCWLKRVVVLFLVVLQQGCWGWDWLKQKPSVPVENSKKTISSEQKSSNLGKRNSKTTKTNDASQKEAESEEQKEQLAKSKEGCSKVKRISKKCSDRFRAFLSNLKVLSKSEQKKQIRELSSSEAEEKLISATVEKNVQLVEILLENRFFTLKQVKGALDQIVSLNTLSKTKKELRMFNLLLRHSIFFLDDLLSKKDSEGIPYSRRAVVYSDSSTWEIVFKILSSNPNKLLEALCVQDNSKRTALHDLFILGRSTHVWETLSGKFSLAELLKVLCVRDNNGKTPLHYLAQYGDRDIWLKVLGRFPDRVMLSPENELLCLADELLYVQDNTGGTLLHDLARYGDADIWPIILPKVSIDHLCVCNNDKKTLFHYLALLKRKEPFALAINRIIDKVCDIRVITELFKEDKYACAPIDYCCMLEGSDPGTVGNNTGRQPFRFFSKGTAMLKGTEMLKCIFDVLSRLDANILARILCRIEYQEEMGVIHKDYAGKLYSIVNDYIKKEYGPDADEIIRKIQCKKHSSE
ncbi:hypothetical protein [Cardinium endosymbiont of Philonthus spinipes]|uniref:hypothetical protein n=1 Tax=Cardinium endosymbiont of Philonthus spinipes TaxID=3077941 RepID=UPI00313E1C27